jgi:hypothetical protein
MERRYETRLQEMLLQAEVSADLVKGLIGRVSSFAESFARSLSEPEQRRHTVEYIQGLLSKMDHKTGEGIAYLHDQERQGIQKFIGHVDWDHQCGWRIGRGRIASRCVGRCGYTEGSWSYSNCPFALALPSERTEAILQGLVEAFTFFGCVPREVWWDNPKTMATYIFQGRQPCFTSPARFAQ